MSLIRVQSLVRTFRTGPVTVPVIRNISFTIEAGECVAIMGPSGSGKSTLMHMIGLLDRPSSGSIVIDAMDVAHLSDDARSRLRGRTIGFVFQAYNLLARNSAIENTQLPLVYAGVDRRERLQRARDALDIVGLSHRAHHFPSQLSGGEQQRVAIARALVADPPIVLADEPTGALDSRTGSDILKLFRALRRTGQTVVLITHDAAVASQCERTIRLRDGEIVADALNEGPAVRRELVS